MSPEEAMKQFINHIDTLPILMKGEMVLYCTKHNDYTIYKKTEEAKCKHCEREKGKNCILL